MQTLRTRKWHLNITKHLMERHFAEPGGQLGTGGNSNTVSPLGIPCQRDLKNRSMATCDTFLWSPLLKGTICPDFFPATWPKKSWLLKKVLRLTFFDPSSEKKCHKESWNRDTMRHVFNYLCISFAKTTRQKSRSFFFGVPFAIPGAEWNHLGLGLYQKLYRCDASMVGSVHPLRAVSKAAPAFAKADGGLRNSPLVQGSHQSPGGVFMVWKCSQMKSSGHPSPSWSSWRRAVVPAWSDGLGLRTLQLTLIHESVLRSSSVVVGTIEAT